MASDVRVVATLTAQDGKGTELLARWPALAEQVHAENGCLSYDLHRVVGSPDTFVVLEHWASAAALGVHGQAAHMKEFGAASRDFMATRPVVVVLEADAAA